MPDTLCHCGSALVTLTLSKHGDQKLGIELMRGYSVQAILAAILLGLRRPRQSTSPAPAMQPTSAPSAARLSGRKFRRYHLDLRQYASTADRAGEASRAV